jgi:hypothetical protein
MRGVPGQVRGWSPSAFRPATSPPGRAVGGQPGTDLLDLLADRYTRSVSHDFERTIRDGNIPVALHVCSG